MLFNLPTALRNGCANVARDHTVEVLLIATYTALPGRLVTQMS